MVNINNNDEGREKNATKKEQSTIYRIRFEIFREIKQNMNKVFFHFATELQDIMNKNKTLLTLKFK